MQLILECTQTLDVTGPLAADPKLVHTSDQSSFTLNGTSTPAAITQAWSDELDLVAATPQDIDLTALARSPLTALDLTGKKIQAYKIVADAANTTAVSVVPGAGTGYHFTGVSGDGHSIAPGGMVAGYNPEALADVAAGARLITFTAAANGKVALFNATAPIPKTP